MNLMLACVAEELWVGGKSGDLVVFCFFLYDAKSVFSLEAHFLGLKFKHCGTIWMASSSRALGSFADLTRTTAPS